jgi:hypothetical protein
MVIEGTVRAGDYSFLYGKGSKNPLVTGVLYTTE